MLSLNEIGDFFAGLFAPFAIIWFAIAFIWQARELKLQRIEYLKGQETAERQLQITKNRNEEDAKRFEQQMATERARLIRATLEAIIVRVNAELGRETQPLLQGDHARCALDAINEVLGLIHNLSSPRDKEQRAKLQSLVDEFPKRLEPIIEMCGDNRAKSIVPISALELEELQRLCFLTQE
ncbi:hypothetical protein [Breoghania corrubedonensis]|uniref:hypothetical protein n=1 Tax=Breoghania corrubedonensis TaxID=665038 RepID=UPI0011B243A2|nr:hypothetical protein [Breoghania corrubedonensis]